MCTSKPKVPKATPVVQRQPYKNAPSRESLASGTDPNTLRRLIAGVATSAQGDTSQASTTKRSQFGGDQVLAPLLGTGEGMGAPGAPAPSGALPAGGGTASAGVAASVAARVRGARSGMRPWQLAA